MALFLHLSDLHLGKAPVDEIADDYKQDFVPIELRIQRQQILLWTLEDLRRVVDERPLDAVVVTGDLTVANREDGFAEFEGLLDALGPLRPDNNRIVVVPGNHDVTWRTTPAAPARYEYFAKHVRSKGYVTPLLDGVDINSTGDFIGDDSLVHHLIDEDAGWVIIPINSADYSGSIEPLPHVDDAAWDDIMQDAEARVGPAGVAELMRLREYDAARVSPQQLQALHALLNEKTAGATIRIAAIHHHLLPVSVREEVKSFESITNLGLVRNFLRENTVQAVMHGHKHREFLYRDHIYSAEGLLDEEAHEVLVIAGATIGTTDWDEKHVCRLVRVEGERRAPRFSLAPVAGKAPGTPADEPIFAPVLLWRSGHPPVSVDTPQVVCGADVDETYERLMTLFETQSQLTHVVCRVEDPASADRLPEAYPDVPDIEPAARQRWYEQLVRWWQKSDSKLRERLRFTHGSRIVQPGLDQIVAAADALRKEPETTRAVITLLDPKIDRVGDVENKYPAFCLVQLLRRERPRGTQLDCIGYFRKQQMRYWWPVNLGELRHIQKLVIDELGGTNAPMHAGPLWTITALAVPGATIPRVAVPSIDRIFDDNEDRLWKLAYAVAWEGLENRAATIRELLALVEELVPEVDFDPDGVPVALEGLSHVAAGLMRFGEYHPQSRARDLAECLNRLYGVNRDYVNATQTKVTKAVHTKWRDQTIALVEEARGILSTLANGV